MRPEVLSEYRRMRAFRFPIPALIAWQLANMPPPQPREPITIAELREELRNEIQSGGSC